MQPTQAQKDELRRAKLERADRMHPIDLALAGAKLYDQMLDQMEWAVAMEHPDADPATRRRLAVERMAEARRRDRAEQGNGVNASGLRGRTTIERRFLDYQKPCDSIPSGVASLRTNRPGSSVATFRSCCSILAEVGRGMHWREYRERLEVMQHAILLSNWSQLEIECARLADEVYTSEHGQPAAYLPGFEMLAREDAEAQWRSSEVRRLMKTPTEEYEAGLWKMLEEARSKASILKAKAMYIEFDLDNGWATTTFLYRLALPDLAHPNEWLCSWTDSVIGPHSPLLSRDYRQYGGYDLDCELRIATTLLLIARTVACLGRSLDRMALRHIPVFAGYHDQDTPFYIPAAE